MLINDYDYGSERFNNYFKTEVNRKGYNTHYTHVNQESSNKQNTWIDKLAGGLTTIGTIVTLGAGFYGLYKLYTNFYRPYKDSMERPFVNKQADNSRVMNGNIFKYPQQDLRSSIREQIKKGDYFEN